VSEERRELGKKERGRKERVERVEREERALE